MKSYCVPCPGCGKAHNLQTLAPDHVRALNAVCIRCACGRMFDAEPLIVSVIMYCVTDREAQP